MKKAAFVKRRGLLRLLDDDGLTKMKCLNNAGFIRIRCFFSLCVAWGSVVWLPLETSTFLCLQKTVYFSKTLAQINWKNKQTDKITN